MKKGLFIGKFLPLHLGHIYAIEYSATMCDELHLVLDEDVLVNKELWGPVKCDYPKGLTRYRWLLDTFHTMKHIQISYHEWGALYNEAGFGEYASRIFNDLGFVPDVIFTSNIDYHDGWKKAFPEIEVVLIDPNRKVRTISGEDIREDLYASWHLISGAARKELCKVICITGTESCGKSTQVKYLQKLYNTSYVAEVGREIWEKKHFGQDQLADDSGWFEYAYEQLSKMNHAKHNANKIVIMDTDAVTTQYYYIIQKVGVEKIEESYLNNTFAKLTNEYEHTGIKEVILEQRKHIKKHIYFEPTVKWIDDGYRSLGEQKTRDLLSNYLKFLYSHYGYEKVYCIEGDYLERLHASIDLIDEILL